MRFFPLMVLSMLALAPAVQAAPKAALSDAAKPDRSAAAIAKAAEEAAIAKNGGFKELSGDERTSEIARAEAYLSGLTTMTANFSQSSADGSKGAGTFALKRPGKMRWQYNLPTPIQLVSDGKVVVYYDPGLDQVTYIGIDDTLAGFLTKDDIRLESPSTKLTGLSKGADGTLRITLVQAKKPTEGTLTLEISDKPLEIKKIMTTDATGNATTVLLTDAKYGEKLDDKLFAFVDPRAVNAKRNKKK